MNAFGQAYWERFQELLSLYENERRDRSTEGYTTDRYRHCDERCTHDVGRGVLLKEIL